MRLFAIERSRSKDHQLFFETQAIAFHTRISQLSTVNETLQKESIALSDRLQATLAELDRSKNRENRGEALKEVKSLRKDLEELSGNVKKMGKVPSLRIPLGGIDMNATGTSDTVRNSTRRNPLLLLDTGRTDSKLGQTMSSSKGRSQHIDYDDCLFQVLDDIETGRVSRPTPRRPPRQPSTHAPDLSATLTCRHKQHR